MESTKGIGSVSIYICGFVFLSSTNLGYSDICVSSVCEYTLEIRWARTMTYRLPEKDNAYNLGLVKDRLRIVNSTYFQEWDDAIGRFVDAITGDVITADGVKRNVITVNGQFPGPAIEVAEGSQVVVHVVNELFREGVTVHWHGISQLYTPWMDGSAYITQCSIAPRTSFTYRFMAHPVGTHWYHSHLENQRIDGLYGAFIVHRTVPEIPEYPVIISDWLHQEGPSLEMGNPYSVDKLDKGTGEMFGNLHNRLYSVDGHELTAVLFRSGLINGRGRYDDRTLPLTTFSVESGEKYRFRLISAAAEYSFEISIDDHKLWVVASDGADMQPLEVTSVVIHAGETIDVEMEANQTAGQYWMRARLQNAGRDDIIFGERPFPSNPEVKEVKAIVKYENSPVTGDPSTDYYTCTQDKKCKIFNCPFPVFPPAEHKECIPVASASAAEQYVNDNKKEFGLDDQEVTEYFFNFGFNWGSSINGNKFVFPTEPFVQLRQIPSALSCDRDSCANADVGCVCTYVKEIPFNKTIQMVLTNFEPDAENFVYQGPHPIHIHGHNFAVLKMGFPEYNESSALFTGHNPDVLCSNRLCKQPTWKDSTAAQSDLNLENPPIKDTVLVPAKGYVVIRFRSNNPGYWSMHCHATTHHMEGMNMVFKEASERISKVPQDFPTCVDFSWTSNSFDAYMTESKQLVQSGTGPSFHNDESGLDEISKPTEQTKENQITVDVETAIGFGAGCAAFGALLVTIPLCIFLGCRTRKDYPSRD